MIGLGSIGMIASGAGGLIAQLQAPVLMNTVGLLRVDLPALPEQQQMNAPIPKPYMCLTNLLDWRRVATRYARCPKVLFSAIAIAAAVVYWL
ncbi:hypothetical protein AVO44_15820 [Ruegeria profundi]|uniref:Uncharacterized protein n=1 Tax=Ruegeria profundi TaxID=1685378 RepID=A0A0X3TRX4_9RHOB|nr:hypothetical protein AVO44_15820 [Ruegeria profundi]